MHVRMCISIHLKLLHYHFSTCAIILKLINFSYVHVYLVPFTINLFFNSTFYCGSLYLLCIGVIDLMFIVRCVALSCPPHQSYMKKAKAT